MTYRSAANGEKPGSYELATRAGKTTINPGQSLQFEQYVTGYGEISSAKLQAYISTDAFDQEASYMLNSIRANEKDDGSAILSWGNNKNILDNAGFTLILEGMKKGELASTMFFDHYENSGRNILMSEKKAEHAPFEYNLKTKDNIRPLHRLLPMLL